MKKQSVHNQQSVGQARWWTFKDKFLWKLTFLLVVLKSNSEVHNLDKLLWLWETRLESEFLWKNNISWKVGLRIKNCDDIQGHEAENGKSNVCKTEMLYCCVMCGQSKTLLWKSYNQLVLGNICFRSNMKYRIKYCKWH